MSKNRSLDFLKSIFKETKDSVLIFDTDLNVYFLSQPLKLLLPNIIIGQNISDILPNDWQNYTSIKISNYESTITPVLDEQQNICLYILKISDKYTSATFEYPFSSDVSKTAIIDLSHRFYTPLTIIFSSLIFLNKSLPLDTLDEKNKKALNTIRQNCYILLKLLGNLSDIASADPFELNTELNLETINIVEFIKKTVSSLSDFSNILKVPIVFHPPASNIFLSVDVRRLEKILLVLVSNCFKYTKNDNQINITLNETQNHIAINVSDSGIGMSKETINKIFSAHRSHNQAKNKVNGSSLIVAKTFVEQMGGTMIIESFPNKGTKISFTISKNLTSTYSLESAKNYFCSQGLFAPKYIEFSDIIEYDNILI